MHTTPDAPIPDHAGLLVVGAGIAGLYTAMRYLEANEGADVVVLDRLNRPGGRLQSDLVEIASGGETVTVRDEEGGMRFNYEMEELMELFKHLGLCDQIVPFPMAPIEGPNYNRYLYRGRAFSLASATADPGVWGGVFDLAPAEQNRQPVEILTEAYGIVYAANRDALVEPLAQAAGWSVEKAEAFLTPTPPDEPTPTYWQVFRIAGAWDGTPLYKWQMWGLLRTMGYTAECCTMLARTLGFEGPFWSTMNAGEAFQLMEDFPADPTYFTFEKGFSTLIDAVVQRVEELGGQIFLSTNVDALEEDGGRFRADVTQAPEYVSASPWVPGGVAGTIEADEVVLALPRKALTTLFATSPALNHRSSEDRARQEQAQQLYDDLQTTTDQRLLKINLYFDHAWWQDLTLPVQYGPSFTDLPVNAVYPFYSLRGVEGDRTATAPPDAGLPAALTIYCDWDNTNFWQGLQEVGPLFDSPLQQEWTDKQPQTLFAASQAVVDQALGCFRELYNTHAIPAPILSSYRLWDGEHDFGYAVHQWGLDAKDDDVIPRLAQPFEGVGLYTCNEAYSDMQGWVNGSLRSANLVLAKWGIDPLSDGICSDAWAGDHRAATKQAVSRGGLWGIAAQPAADRG